MAVTVFKSVKGWGVDLPSGLSGSLDLERAFLERVGELFELFCSKQADYGPNNIGATGLVGLGTRLNDKVQRLLTLQTGAPMNESLRDTLLDIADYGVIALLVHDGRWPGEAPLPKAEDPRAQAKLSALKALIHERGIATTMSQIKEILYDG